MYCYFETAVRQTIGNTHTHTVCLIIWQQGAHCAVLWLRAAHHPEGRNIFTSKVYPWQSRARYHMPSIWGGGNADRTRKHVSQLRHQFFLLLMVTFALFQTDNNGPLEESWENIYFVASFKACRALPNHIFVVCIRLLIEIIDVYRNNYYDANVHILWIFFTLCSSLITQSYQSPLALDFCH